jgi:hypothetical protein
VHAPAPLPPPQELPEPREAQRAAQAADLDAQKLSVRVTYMESEAKRTAELLKAVQVGDDCVQRVGWLDKAVAAPPFKRVFALHAQPQHDAAPPGPNPAPRPQADATKLSASAASKRRDAEPLEKEVAKREAALAKLDGRVNEVRALLSSFRGGAGRFPPPAPKNVDFLVLLCGRIASPPQP